MPDHEDYVLGRACDELSPLELAIDRHLRALGSVVSRQDPAERRAELGRLRAAVRRTQRPRWRKVIAAVVDRLRGRRRHG